MNYKITLTCSDLFSTSENTTSPTRISSLFTIFLTLVLSFAFSAGVWGQTLSASATWALTSDGSVTTVGNVTATSVSRTTGSIGGYNSNGVYSNAWNSVLDLNKYYEYTITPNTGSALTISTISFFYSVSGGSMDFLASYSIDNFVTSTPLGSVISFSNTSSDVQFTPTFSPITVNSGSTLKVRVYGHSASGSNRTFRNKTFVIYGTTYSCTATSLSAQPSDQSITYGGNINFSVTGSGTAPLTYQWQEKVGAGSFTDISDGGVYSGVSTSTLTLTKPTVAMSTNQYRCVVSNACGTVNSAHGVLTVNTKAASVTPAAGQTKVFGASEPTLTGSTDGFLEGDNVSATYSREVGENVGSYLISAALDPSGVLANYTITYNTANFTITKATPTITTQPTASAITYGQTLASSTLSGGVASVAGTFAFTTPSTAPNAGTALQSVTFTPTDITNYNTVSFNVNVTVNKATPIITWANPADITYGTALSVTQLNATTSVAGSFVYTPVSGTVLNAGNTQTLSVSFTPTDTDNYNSATKDVVINVEKRAITITADAKSKTYGDTDPALTYQITDGSLAFSDVFTGSLTRDAGESVASYAITQGSVALNSNYTLNYVSDDLTITQLPVTVTANSGQTKVYGALNPVYAYTSSPAVGTVLANGHLIGFSGTQIRVPGENVGNYAISQGTLDNTNYAITYNGGSFEITPLAVTVTADAKTKVYGESDPALTFVSSPIVGFVLPNNETISFGGALSRAVGQDVGTYLISQNTVANSNYTITYVPANLEITKRSITVKADAKSKVYGSVDPALTYQITVGSLAYSDAFTGALTRVAGETVLGSPYAIQQGSLALSANYTLTYQSANLTITTAPVTSSVTVTSETFHYSDQVTFTATIVGGAPLVSGGPQAATSATFKVGAQTMGTANFTVVGLDIVATGTYAMLETVAGQMAPGSKTVTAVINSPDANFAISNLNPTTPLTINKEEAVVNYIGNEITATQSTTNLTANLDLRVSVQDIADGFRGDITKATVTFKLDGNEIMPATPISQLVDPYTGIISKTHPVTLSKNTPSETFTLEVLVNNYYVGNDETVITVYVPTGDFITGGGHIIPTASAGTLPSTVGTKTNFGFNVKFNKKGTNLQGKLNFIWRSGGKIYQAKSNATEALGVDIANPNAKLAVFTSKCNITDITDPLNPMSLGGNKIMHVTMTDKGEPGVNDEISFTLWDGNILMYSSNWTGTSSAKMLLRGGNIVVHSGFSTGTTNTRTDETVVTSTTNLTAVENEAAAVEAAIFTVKAYPNPSTDYFKLQLSGVNPSEAVELNVFDVNGRHVYSKKGNAFDHYQFGEQLKAGVYFIDVRAGESSGRVKVIKH